ncbi:MAG: hypothetical protein EOO38_23365 [Cytophagaceae bacterium]|nr:MAG: hypothetical protein EOO38_23365 [Cytophagaceae bacterium]
MTVGKDLEDGSHLVIKIPEFCYYNNGQSFVAERQTVGPNWIDPSDVIVSPVFAWNNKRPHTTIVENYFSPITFTAKSSRFKNVRARVTFLPPNAKNLKTKNVLSTADDPPFIAGSENLNADGLFSKRTHMSLFSIGGMVGVSVIPVPNQDRLQDRHEERFIEYAPEESSRR